jgi:hypothetical protein
LPTIYLNDLSTGTLGQEKSFTRISFVCYLREKLVNCKLGPTKEYYKRIDFSPKTGTRKKSNK